MSVASEVREGVVVVKMPERLVMANAGSIRDELKRLIGNESSRLVVDMGQVDFADSSGLSVLISALQAAQSAAGDVVLCGVTSKVQALIEMTRLHHVFKIFDSADDAVAELA